jgi:uncharacterized protein YwgA
MNRLQRAAVLTQLAQELAGQGSWCGETHLQKATYFLQHLLQVPLNFKFTLYKFGPYSFDLDEELTALRADELLELKVRHPSYGPSLLPTETSSSLRERHPATLGKYAPFVAFVATKLSGKGVTELERVATALYVTLESGEKKLVSARANRIRELKPHVPLEAAKAAVEELDTIADEAKKLFGT